MKYSDYRDFRRRLDAEDVHTISWVERVSDFYPAGGPYGLREEIRTVKTVVTTLSIKAEPEEAKKVFNRFEPEIRRALGAGPLDDIITSPRLSAGVTFEFSTEESL